MKLCVLSSLFVALTACASNVGVTEPVASASAALDTVTTFGSNPGHLTMMRYVPASMPQNAPLVVALHGCTQSATDFSAAGWNQMADQYKFYVVYAQQNTANNPVSCFDWFGTYNNPADKTNITRGTGENGSIKQMVDKMKADFSIDARRVFVAGFSSGAAMAAVMLATWPDVFAAGGIDAGVPYNCPSTQNSDVWTCMNPGKVLAASDWGQFVRAAYSGYSGPYPRVTIWQGTQDTTVGTANSTELVKQWTNVHGISQTPSSSDMLDGYPRQLFKDGNGNVVVESHAITGMGHGFAIDPAHACGAAGQYSIDKQTCTALHMAQFFGITSPLSPDGGADAADDAAPDASASDGAAVDSGSQDASAPDSSASFDSGHASDSGHSSDSGGADASASPGADAGEPTPEGGSSFAGCSLGPRGRSTDAALVLIALALVARASRRRARRQSP